MYMVRAGFCFDYFYTLLLAQLSDYYPYIFVDLSIYNLSAVFWCKNDVILAIPLGM